MTTGLVNTDIDRSIANLESIDFLKLGFQKFEPRIEIWSLWLKLKPSFEILNLDFETDYMVCYKPCH